MTRSEWRNGLWFVCVLALLPFAAHWVRRDAQRTCAFDGGRIDPLYRVRVVDADGNDREFCCITCADRWLEAEKREPRAVFVTDEISGEEVNASAAVFVRNYVVTNRTTGNRIHAFRARSDADHDAGSAGGWVLDASETPFARER